MKPGQRPLGCGEAARRGTRGCPGETPQHVTQRGRDGDHPRRASSSADVPVGAPATPAEGSKRSGGGQASPDEVMAGTVPEPIREISPGIQEPVTPTQDTGKVPSPTRHTGAENSHRRKNGLSSKARKTDS